MVGWMIRCGAIRPRVQGHRLAILPEVSADPSGGDEQVDVVRRCSERRIRGSHGARGVGPRIQFLAQKRDGLGFGQRVFEPRCRRVRTTNSESHHGYTGQAREHSAQSFSRRHNRVLEETMKFRSRSSIKPGYNPRINGPQHLIEEGVCRSAYFTRQTD